MNGLMRKLWNFHGMLLPSSVAVETYFGQLGSYVETAGARHSNLAPFDSEWTSSYR